MTKVRKRRDTRREGRTHSHTRRAFFSSAGTARGGFFKFVHLGLNQARGGWRLWRPRPTYARACEMLLVHASECILHARTHAFTRRRAPITCGFVGVWVAGVSETLKNASEHLSLTGA
jgi:hypothetical protein